MSQPVLLILGAGSNIGVHVTKTFATKGYRVALASRSEPTIDAGQVLHVPVDLAKPELVPSVFRQVREKLGEFPSVVVYNGKSSNLWH